YRLAPGGHGRSRPGRSAPGSPPDHHREPAMTGTEPGRERRVSPVKVALWIGLAYLVVAKWSALHPPASAARVLGPRLDLAWPAPRTAAGFRYGCQRTGRAPTGRHGPGARPSSRTRTPG